MSAISPKHKLIFVHIPKTGGVTVESVMKKNDKDVILDRIKVKDKFYIQHKTAREFPRDLFNGYTIFSVIREPYSRALSMYNYFNPRYGNRYKNSLSFFKAIQSGELSGRIFWPQAHYCDGSDVVISLNRLTQGLIDLGLNKVSTKPRNVSKKISANLTGDEKKLISSIYGPDFDLWGDV